MENVMLKQLEKIGTPEEAKHYTCKVISLTFSHTILTIRVHHHKLPICWHLTFLGVHYFQGPTFWTGANFIEASKELTFEVWDRIPNLRRLDESRTLHYERLYMAKLCPVFMLDISPQPIFIVAGGISLSEVRGGYTGIAP